MALSRNDSSSQSASNLDLSIITEMKDKSTQYNFYLINKQSMKSKSVSCELKETIDLRDKKVLNRVKPLQRNKQYAEKSTQCCTILPNIPPKKSEIQQKKPKTADKSSSASIISKSKYCQTIPALYGNFLGKISQLINRDYHKVLQYSVTEDQHDQLVLRVTRKQALGVIHLECGLEPIELCIWETGKCHLYILFKTVKVLQLGNEEVPKLDNENKTLTEIVATEKIITFNNDDEPLENIANNANGVHPNQNVELRKVLDTISGRLGHALCPGVNEMKLKNESQMEHYVPPKSLKSISYPFQRYQSVRCEVYHQYYLNKIPEKLKMKQCKFCATLTNEISKAKKRKATETPTRKYKRQRIASNYPIKFLTPKSKARRLGKIQKSRFEMKRKISKLEKQIEMRQIELSDPLSNEMSNIVKTINDEFPGELEKTFESTEGFTKQLLKEVWTRDSNLKHLEDQRDFLVDQADSLKTKKKRKWNTITLRIALAVYCRSPAAYKALRGFNILNLPCEATLKAKSKKLNLNPGIQEQFLAQEQLKYQSFKEEKERMNERVPMGDGILVMDEVKVIDKIMWNSKNHEFVGYAMNEDDYAQLTDIYKGVAPITPSPTQYILQFLWRDLTSSYDIIGPYFTSSYPLQQKSLVTSLYETIEAFHAYGFKTMGIVWDGASENLALIKVTMGLSGSFGFEFKDGKYNFDIQPTFENPFSEDSRKIHWIICPSHQLKNMIGQLFASRADGPKEFCRNNIPFGWRQLEEVRERDKERTKVGQLRRARYLEDSYLVRDAWTKLNVAPSKVMQQEDVLCELYEYAIGEKGSKESREQSMEAYKFLRACNQLFEYGFLAKKIIDSEASEVMKSICMGYSYFEEWILEILSDRPDYNFKSPRQERFLSWQTWDLLRISVFGLKYLVKDFFLRYPTHFLSPIRINGSSIESLFSQIKYATGGKVTSLNYISGLKSTLVRRNVHGSHRGNKDYRDQMLYIREYEL